MLAAVAQSGNKRLMENTLRKRILILGGGFAGLTVAMEGPTQNIGRSVVGLAGTAFHPHPR